MAVYANCMGKLATPKIYLDQSLKNLLAANNIRPTSLANKLNINKSSLHGWIHGVVPQSLFAIVKISSHFDISLDKLCLGTLEMSKPYDSEFAVFVSEEEIRVLKRILNANIIKRNGR